MNESTNVNTPRERIALETQGGRRLLLKSLGSGVLGAAAIAAGMSGSERVAASQSRTLAQPADIFIGRSSVDQTPAHFIECPLYFMNGDAAGAVHTLDVSNWRMTRVIAGTVSAGVDVIEPDFSASAATAITQGSDGELYLVVAAEGTITSATGLFRGVSKAIFRSKYKAAVDPTGNPLLIACVDCVILLSH